VQRLAHRPADDLGGMQIQYGGQVKPAFAGGDVGLESAAFSRRTPIPAIRRTEMERQGSSDRSA